MGTTNQTGTPGNSDFEKEVKAAQAKAGATSTPEKKEGEKEGLWKNWWVRLGAGIAAAIFLAICFWVVWPSNQHKPVLSVDYAPAKTAQVKEDIRKITDRGQLVSNTRQAEQFKQDTLQENYILRVKLSGCDESLATPRPPETATPRNLADLSVKELQVQLSQAIDEGTQALVEKGKSEASLKDCQSRRAAAASSQPMVSAQASPIPAASPNTEVQTSATAPSASAQGGGLAAIEKKNLKVDTKQPPSGPLAESKCVPCCPQEAPVRPKASKPATHHAAPPQVLHVSAPTRTPYLWWEPGASVQTPKGCVVERYVGRLPPYCSHLIGEKPSLEGETGASWARRVSNNLPNLIHGPPPR